MNNPFIYGHPVSPADFFNRLHALRRVVGRLLSAGQSTGIIGQPRIGKTSLLRLLGAPEMRATLYRSAGDKMLFCYLDTHTFGAEFTAAQFWELALTPIREQIVNPSPESPLAEQYRVCRDKQFASFMLGNFFALLREEGWRLVLLWDEFDVLLYHPILNSAQFFGGLRSVATRSRGALAIVIASRLSLPTLNEQSQQHSRHMGSPYFNYFAEVTLGAFPKEDVEKLLARAGDRFTEEDKRAICTVAGGHPFLLQAAAAAIDVGSLAKGSHRWQSTSLRDGLAALPRT